MKAMEGVTILIHIAAPDRPLEFNTYEKMIDPVHKGCDAIIEGIKINKVKKVIITSSIFTIFGCLEKEKGYSYSELDTIDMTRINDKNKQKNKTVDGHIN